MRKAIFVVAGATGAQGGGAVSALLADSDRFIVRALTRKPSSANAQALAQRGVQVVQGDLNDKESLRKAFEGASGLFLVTDSFEGANLDPGVELQHGRNAIDAAKEAGVSHIVWSALEDTRRLPGVSDQLPELPPGYLVSISDVKGEITEYLKTSGVPYTVLLTSIFFQNFINKFPFVRQEDGSHAFFSSLGDKAHPAHDVNDIGATAAVVFKDPAHYAGSTVPVVGEYLNMSEAAATISEVTGKQLRHIDISDEAAAAAGYPGAAELAAMYIYFKHFPFYKDLRPIDKAAYKGKSFSEWAHDNQDALAARLNPEE